jgi:type I restriction enzyme R subunit
MPEPAPPPEAQARRRIDALLEASGWTVQGSAAVHLAVGEADYGLFLNGLDPDPTARRVFRFHRPETLGEWLRAEVMRRAGKADAPAAATLKGRMRLAQELNRAGMWPAQIRAVENLERSFCEGRLRALLQMATGGGKTFTPISAGYRLITQGGARRVLFLVDRGNLGRQALKEFQAYTTPDDGRKFTELFNVVNLNSNRIDPACPATMKLAGRRQARSPVG